MKGGVRWVQLRMKNASDSEIEEQAAEALKITQHYGGILIINDNPYIAHKVNADGVHLGRMDIAPSEARLILGPAKIIGGTSNTLDDIHYLRLQQVDYIGLGPFRNTNTEKQLMPVISLPSYSHILEQINKEGASAPLIAIGGILESDLDSIFATGIHGVAISRAIALSNDITATSKQFVKDVNHLLKERK